MHRAALNPLEIELRTGDEPFCGGGLSLRLLDYWRWSGSSLMDNTARGMLAEFFVAAAIGQHQIPRVEWERYDLRTGTGVTIEVKSSAAIQTHKQPRESPIEFGIGPRKGWDRETGQYSEEARRWADLYVFCVLEGTEPLDVDRWQSTCSRAQCSTTNARSSRQFASLLLRTSSRCGAATGA